MGSSWRLLTDRQILWGKNEIPSRLMTIFQEADKYMRADWARTVDELNSVPAGQEIPPELEGAQWDDDFVDTSEHFGYRTTVGTALTRLRLMGFTPEASRRSMAELRRSQLREDGEAEDVLLVRSATGEETPHQMSCEQVVATGLAAYIKGLMRYGDTDEDLDPIETACANDLDFYIEYYTEDPRFLLAALLLDQNPRNTLTLDLSDLLSAGYCNSTEDLSAQAIHELGLMTASTGPIIVITEGKFDAQVIPWALRLVCPEVAGYFKFWDLETTKAAGGTDQVVKNMRSFAAAGVMNRVIGILDNDTAGRHAENQLARTPLPDHYAVCRLPDLDYARSYPTLGPSGASSDDVTGRACSVEFYFGRDCLRGPDGTLIPVRWKSLIDSMTEYQGELANKAYVQERIKEMLREAETSGKQLGSEWDPMRRLAQTLISLAEPKPE
ncbi:HEPN/Toprim-associated domain-containing protein [Streptomyces violaceoruber]|uniref:HEPN/Toprim-associated domain-containing protein n=1 Tax=Streptomyces violaceoruber group TaxID=2867121 RepID=UPI0033E67B8D